MYLDEILAAQKRGEARGLPSICSASPVVLREALKLSEKYGLPALIEATCNQVNQFGGYTGMTPKDFAAFVRGITEEVDYPFERVILGGDHLGPNVWQEEPADVAMEKARGMVWEYVQAGFTKIHLDCSMRLANDPAGALDMGVSAKRVAQLARVAEKARIGIHPLPVLRYTIGTEVPSPGGAMEHEEHVRVTAVEDAQQVLDITREAFLMEGLENAWERVRCLVVQPGVEFGDDFVLPYRPELAYQLSQFIESQPLVYEAHSTDYQTRDALQSLVRDHFAILKVGPALTFAFREAVFALAMIENEIVVEDQRSNIMQVLDDTMMKHPGYWKKYYHGTEKELAFKRKYSLSDRVRYYWVQPDVAHAYARLLENLGDKTLPYALLSQFAGYHSLNAKQVIREKIQRVLKDYLACL